MAAANISQDTGDISPSPGTFKPKATGTCDWLINFTVFDFGNPVKILSINYYNNMD